MESAHEDTFAWVLVEAFQPFFYSQDNAGELVFKPAMKAQFRL